MTIPFSASPLPHGMNPWFAAGIIATVVLTSTCGEVLTAAAMKSIGDLDEIRARAGAGLRHFCPGQIESPYELKFRPEGRKTRNDCAYQFRWRLYEAFW
jgi:hypothetical protein